MKKQLIAVGLAGLLTIPTVSFGAEMAGPSLYGSFRTGLTFGSGDASVGDFTSRWGFKGSHEVAEGLTASYKYESKINTTNAESSSGVGHKHPEVAGSEAIAAIAAIAGTSFHEFRPPRIITFEDDTFGEDEDMAADEITTATYNPLIHELDPDANGNPILVTVMGTFESAMTEVSYARQTVVTPATAQNPEMTAVTYFEVHSSRSTHGHDAVDAVDAGITQKPDEVEGAIAASEGTPAIDDDGGPGGRLSYVSLSGGFGTITLGQIWSASANHYGFKVDPSYVNGVFGGASYRPGNTISYSSSAGDVTFQLDKVTGDGARVELGTSANLGPVGVGLGYWSNSNDEAGFTGVAVSTGAAGVNLTIGLGSSTNASGAKSKWNILHVGGSVGDSGLSYAVQVANSDKDAGVGDQNLLVVTNSLGSGASLIFEHVSHGDPTEMDASLLGLKVDF